MYIFICIYICTCICIYMYMYLCKCIYIYREREGPGGVPVGATYSSSEAARVCERETFSLTVSLVQTHSIVHFNNKAGSVMTFAQPICI